MRTSRPLLWFTHFTLFIYGGLQSNIFHLNSFQFILGLLIFSLPFSLFIYAINDYYDLKTDLLNPRKGAIFGEKHGVLAIKDLKIWGLIGLLVSLILAIFLGTPVLVIFIMLSFVLYFYSALPLRFKSIPILDTLTGGGLYCYLIALLGYFTFAKDQAQILDIFKPQFFFFALFGLAGHLMGAVVDVAPDRKSNVRTSAVFFGINKTVTFCIISFLVCLYLARRNLLLMFFMAVAITICSFYYSEKWRENLFLPNLVAYLSLIFFAITILLYFLSPNLLKF